jgi:hypothetical protein
LNLTHLWSPSSVPLLSVLVCWEPRTLFHNYCPISLFHQTYVTWMHRLLLTSL